MHARTISTTIKTLSSAAILAVAAVGCGSGGSGGGNTVPANATVIRALPGITWDAKTYTAQSVGGKVSLALRDDSSEPHNLHLIAPDDSDVGIALDVDGQGDVHADTVSLAPGTYKVICTIAGHGNMKATLTVT